MEYNDPFERYPFLASVKICNLIMASRPVRILLCSSNMEPGGSERQLLYLLRGLDRSRFDPMLYLLYDQGALLNDIPQDIRRFAFWNEHREPRLSWPGRIHQWQIAHLQSVIARERIDVTYDRLFHMTMIAGPATRRANVPRVSTIVSPPEFDVERSENRWRWIKRRRLALAYRESAALLTVASGTAESASQYYGIPRDRFQVVPSPIDRARIEQLAEEAVPAPGFRKDRVHVLAAGRLSAEKGHRYLIEAVGRYLKAREMGSLPDLELHLAGNGPLRESLVSLTIDLGIADHVHFYGHVPNPYAMMHRCDLFCMPSLYEGMPNAMLEAMACGAPVVASNTKQGPGELLREHPIGQLVPPADPDALCTAIQDRFRSPQPWLDRAELAKSYVKTHHDMSRWLDTMSGIFLSACKISTQ
jgi:glycosyltransferase involved in cell wall biosynthesis